MFPDVGGIPTQAMQYLFACVQRSEPGEWIERPDQVMPIDDRQRRRAIRRLESFGLLQHRRVSRRIVVQFDGGNQTAPLVQVQVQPAARALYDAWRSTC